MSQIAGNPDELPTEHDRVLHTRDAAIDMLLGTGGVNHAVPWFCMASVLYYRFDVSLLSDAKYDELAKRILQEWDSVTHPHRRLFTQDDLAAGSMYAYAVEHYPASVRCAAWAIIRDTPLNTLDDDQRKRLLAVPPATLDPRDQDVLDRSLGRLDDLQRVAPSAPEPPPKRRRGVVLPG